MKPKVLVDTGPLVAFFNRRDRYHSWAVAQLAAVEPPVYTCEAVLSETCFLLATHSRGGEAVLELIYRGLVMTPFRLQDEVIAVRKLLARYTNVTISLADACLVRMTELYEDRAVLTLDRDFKVYRKHGRQVIPTIMPEEL